MSKEAGEKSGTGSRENGTERRRKSGTGQRPEDASPGLAGGLKAFVLNLGRHISQGAGETERSV